MKKVKVNYYHRTFCNLSQMYKHGIVPVSFNVNKYTGSVNAKFKQK